MKELISYVPKKYISDIKDFYKDEDGYWLQFKLDGKYILDGYISEYIIHEDKIQDVLRVLRENAILKREVLSK